MMRSQEAQEVRKLALFRDCSDAVFDELMATCYLQRFPAGMRLIAENDNADFLHIVIEGLVEMFARHGGRETTIGFIRPIETFILAAVLKDQVYLQSARTLEVSRILLIPAQRVREAMRSDAGFMSAIVAELATRYRSMVKEVKNQKLRGGGERLANWLLRAHRVQGATGTVTIPFEKRVLATRLGMTPENLSRAFAALSAHGVAVAGPRVTIGDLAALTTHARPNPLIDDPES